MKIKCHYCGKEVNKHAGHVNRAKEMGNNVYCGRKCAGLGRRCNSSEVEEKTIKYFYDAFIRLADEERFKKQRQEYFIRDYAENPEKYKAIRKKRQPKHNEYCRRPEYKKWKKNYDQTHRAKKKYGKYFESFIALQQLAGLVDNRQAKADQKNITKSQKRKRNAKNTQRKELESCSMGLYQPS